MSRKEEDYERLEAINADLAKALTTLMKLETSAGECNECYVCAEHEDKLEEAYQPAHIAIEAAKS